MKLEELKVLYDTVSERLSKAEADVVRLSSRKEELAVEVREAVELNRKLLAELGEV
jgi:hypothetical protein